MVSNYKIGAAGLFALLLASCLPGATVAVSVKSQTDVRFAVSRSDGLAFCLTGADIRRVGGPVVWSVIRSNDAGCIRAFRFPETPTKFRTLIHADRLLPGDYSIGVNGGTAMGSGEFHVD
jgi:hypothetical protein